MFSRIFAIVLFLTASTVQAVEYPTEVIEYIDNTRIVAFLNEPDILATETWQPFTSAPPLSMARAIDAVHARAASSRLIGIELKPIPRHKDHWFYLVKTQDMHQTKPTARYFVVLMNGKVVSALAEPESIK